MKKPIGILIVALWILGFTSAHAQPGGGMGGMAASVAPEWSAAMSKLFGDNPAFSALMEHQSKSGSKDLSIKGKMAFDAGKARTEIDMSSVTSQMNSRGMAQMKAAGFDLEGAAQITRPDQMTNYMVYPAMKAYTAEAMLVDSKPDSDLKIEITELGKETVDGHSCIKNKAVVTDKEGKKHEFTVWNATDLNKFPVRFETTENGRTSIVLFKDIKLSKPDAALFEIPTGFERYESMMDLMMKRMSGAMRGQ